jgi:hypothetical protein
MLMTSKHKMYSRNQDKKDEQILVSIRFLGITMAKALITLIQLVIMKK